MPKSATRQRFTLFASLALVTVASGARADGMRLRDGRFAGKVIVVELTPDQTCDLDRAREWWRTNGSRPDAWRDVPDFASRGLVLTSTQRAQVWREAGVAPRRLDVYETRDGANDCTCGACNRALRFDARRVELPVEYLMSDSACEQAKAEH